MHKLVVFAMATWRLTSLFVHEDGPFKIFHRIREWAGVIHDKDGMPCGNNNSFFAGLLSCFWCTSVWAAAIISVFSLDWTMYVPTLLCASAGAILIEEGLLWLEQ